MAAKDVEAGRAHVVLRIRDLMTQGLKAAEKKMQQFGRSMAMAGSVVSLGLGVPLAGVATVFADFDSAMAQVGGISGAAGEQLAKLREEAKRLGASTQFTAAQAAQGMVYLGMAGFNTEQILSGIGPVLNVAASGMMDLARAADIVSDATTAFGLSAEDTSRVADVMAKTATSSNTSIEQMGEAFTYAAAQGKAAGQTVENVSAALGILGNSGLKASIAGTGVQGIFKRLIEPDALAQLNRMGVAFADARGNIRPLHALMQDLQRATSGMTQLKKLQTFEELFGLHAKSAIILADNSQALTELTGKLYQSQGSAADMAKAMNNSVKGAWLSFMSAVESIMIAVGEAMDGPLTTLLGIGAQLFRLVGGLIDRFRGIVQVVAIAAGAVAGIGAAFASLGVAVINGGFIIGLIGSAFAFIGSVLATIFSPLGMLIGVLIALGGVAIYFRSAMYEAFQGLLVWASPVIDAFWRILEAATGAVAGIVDALSAGNIERAGAIAVAALLSMFWQAASEIPGIGSLLASGFGQALLAGRWDLIVGIMMGKVKLAILSAWNGIANIWSAALTGLGAMWDITVKGITDAWRSAVNGIAQGILWVMEKLGLAAEGAQAELAKMNAATQGQADAAFAASMAARVAAEQKARDQRAASEAALASDIAAMQSEATAAAAEQGVTTAAAAAARAKAELESLLKQSSQPATADGKKSSIADRLAGLGGGVAGALPKIESRGTFTAAAASVFGGGRSGLDQVAANTRMSVTVLKQIRDKPAPQFS